MDDPLVQALTQLSDTLIILAGERETLARTLAQLQADVVRLHEEMFTLRAQLPQHPVAPTVTPCAIYPSLVSETRGYVDTACAAYHLGRKAQTLRAWACYENGPLRPIRINGRLAWAVADLLRLEG